MKNKYIRVRTSERRLNKLRLYASLTEKTMTQVIDECIDSLKIPNTGNSDARGLANASLSSTHQPHQPNG